MPSIKLEKNNDSIKELNAIIGGYLQDLSLIGVSREVLIKSLHHRKLLVKCERLCSQDSEASLVDKGLSSEASNALNAWHSKLVSLISSSQFDAISVGAILVTITAEQCDGFFVANCAAWVSHLNTKLSKLMPDDVNAQTAISSVLKSMMFLFLKAKNYAELFRELALQPFPRFVKLVLQLLQSDKSCENFEKAAIDCLTQLVQIFGSNISTFMPLIENVGINLLCKHPDEVSQLLAAINGLEIKATKTLQPNGTVTVAKAAGNSTLKLVSTIHALIDQSGAIAGNDAYKPEEDMLPAPWNVGEFGTSLIPVKRAQLLRQWDILFACLTKMTCYPFGANCLVPLQVLLQLLFRVFSITGQKLPKHALISVSMVPRLYICAIDFLVAFIRRFQNSLTPFVTLLKQLLSHIWSLSSAFLESEPLSIKLVLLCETFITDLGWVGLSHGLLDQILTDVSFGESEQWVLTASYESFSSRSDKSDSKSPRVSEAYRVETNACLKRRGGLRFLLALLSKIGPCVPAQVRNQIDKTLINWILEDEVRAFKLRSQPAHVQFIQRKISRVVVDNRLLSYKCLVASSLQQTFGQIPTLPYVLPLLSRGILREHVIKSYCEQAILLLNPIFRPQLPSILPPGFTEYPTLEASSACEKSEERVFDSYIDSSATIMPLSTDKETAGDDQTRRISVVSMGLSSKIEALNAAATSLDDANAQNVLSDNGLTNADSTIEQVAVKENAIEIQSSILEVIDAQHTIKDKDQTLNSINVATHNDLKNTFSDSVDQTFQEAESSSIHDTDGASQTILGKRKLGSVSELSERTSDFDEDTGIDIPDIIDSETENE